MDERTLLELLLERLEVFRRYGRTPYLCVMALDSVGEAAMAWVQRMLAEDFDVTVSMGGSPMTLEAIVDANPTDAEALGLTGLYVYDLREAYLKLRLAILG